MLSCMKRGPEFYRQVVALSAPIVLQNLITNALSMADTFMVGLLGEVPMAGLTLANIPFFILQLFFFGVQSGAAVLISQYWGKGDRQSINRVIGVSWYGVGAVSLLIALLMMCVPRQVMSMFGNDPAALDVAARYARIVALSYVFNGINLVYLGAHRSMENPKVGVYMLAASMTTNTFLNWVLIFGKLGAPRMGVEGAALATLISRMLESAIMLFHIRKNSHFLLEPAKIFRPGRAMVNKLIKYSFPVILNETLWGLGASLYPIIMGHMENSTEILAAYTISGNVEKILMVIIYGLSSTAAVIVGREIGAGHRDTVYEIGCALNILSVAVNTVVGALLACMTYFLFPNWLYPLFSLSPRTVEVITIMLTVIAIMLPMRGFSHVTIIGVLRGGGDVQAATLIDLLPLWLVAVPIAAVMGLWLEWGVLWVYIGMSVDQIIKILVGVPRIRSRKWINDITVT